MQQLESGSLLQGGRYEIEKVLGQGGFGITYLATQELLNRKVAIKEFFYKEYCERDETTSHVTLGTTSNRVLVERFMEKFIKEARTISTLNHPHIIRIYDIFKENNTAYYVMEYIEGESLAELVKQQGALSENVAVDYIKQVASALEFIHQHSINHLDVKPANIMVRKEDNQAVLIDFGLSKQYDASGEQTSTTPVGISYGYAPMEQYNVGGVGTFSPQTDIYALGATLYKLVTGNTPPQAIEIFNDGLPELPSNVSSQIREVIKKSMQPKKAERYNCIEEFVQQLNGKEESVLRDEETIVIQESRTQKQTESESAVNRSKITINYSVAIICAIVLITGLIGFFVFGTENNESSLVAASDNTAKEIEKQRVNDSIKTIKEQACFAELRKKEEEKRKMTHGIINGHEYVDLGLSVKWATCNIGALKPSDYGGYYAWGESVVKDIYTTFNSITYDKDLKDISANNPTYDTAKSIWGSSWRIPTKEEMDELVEKCKWKLMTQDFHIGFKITGPNGNSIFLPISGRYTGKQLQYKGEHTSYFSATPYHSGLTYAYCLKIGKKSAATGREYYEVSWEYRSTGAPIRPVTK